MISFAKFHPNFQRILLKIWQFLLRFRSRNLYKMFAQNAGNRISEVLDFKIFRDGMPPDPPTGADLLRIPHAKPWIRPWLAVKCKQEFAINSHQLSSSFDKVFNLIF